MGQANHHFRKRQWLRSLCHGHWVPLLLGAVATVGVLGLRQQLLVQEQLYIQHVVQQKANAIATDLNQELAERVLALQRMADRWRASSGTPQALWQADAANYVRQYYGFQAIEWVAPSFHVRWVEPLQGNEAAQNFDMNHEQHRRVTLQVSRDLRQPLLTRTISLTQGGTGFLACVPLFVPVKGNLARRDRFDGFMVGVFRFQTFFDSVIPASPDYKVQVFGQNGLLYSQRHRQEDLLPPILSKTALVQAYGADWRVQVAPMSAVIAAGRSPLPDVVLWGGLAGAWTLALVVYLAQRSAYQSQCTQRMNQQLKDEVRHRQQFEAKLQESEERLQLALEASAEGWWDWNIATDVVDRSPQYLRLLGYEVGEFPDIFASWETAIHPDDFPPMMERLTAHLQDDSASYACEYRVRTKSGEWKWISDYGKVVARDTENKPLRMIGTFKDIADRKQAEEALRQSEATKRAIIQAIPDLLIRMRADGSYVDFISDSRFNIVNPLHTRENVNVSDILSPELAQLRMHYAQQALTLNTPQVYEHAILIDGQQCYEEVRIVPLLQQEVLVMVRDITEHKQAELALQLSEERLQMALEASGDGLWDWDLISGMIYLNPYYQEMLGYYAGELVMDSNVWESMIHPDDKPWVLERLQNHFKDDVVQYSFDYRMRCKSGEWKWIADYGKVVLRDQQGKPLRMIGTHRDISDRKQKEIALKQAMEAAEAANLAKSMFLANMSHELRTPLNVILGFAQVMTHDPSLTPSQKEDLYTIRRSGDHLLSLINDVLDLSKIEAGHCLLEETGFDLIALLYTLRTMMMERAKSKQLQLIFDIAPTVPQFVIADEQKLRQILLNLLSNAIKFTQKGRVTLRVGVGDEIEGEKKPPLLNYSMTLQFEVIDTGVGIALSEQDLIFDAFVQAEAGKKSVSGTGLGLTISRKLLELMHGTIALQSSPNEGSRFIFTVPVRSANRIDVQPEPCDRTVIGMVPGQPHRRVLVVDDQRENRLLMVRLLSQLGLEVREATNGQEAVQLWQEWQPDLTWMDIRMPGMDGYEATKWIRDYERERINHSADGKHPLPSLPAPAIIIALTAQASQSDRTLALAAGCNDYISKPFREETVFLKLSEHLGLEYVYADPSSGTQHPAIAPFHSHQDATSLLDDALLAVLPTDWLQELEDAVLCGKDWAIVELAMQLPPEFARLSNQLIELADKFQFEEILNWMHYSFGRPCQEAECPCDPSQF